MTLGRTTITIRGPEATPGRAAHFEGLRQVVAPLPTGIVTITEALASARLRCRRGDPPHTGTACLGCPHLVNFLRTPEGLLVRCLYSDDDPVHAIMTLASAAVTVAWTTPPAAAARYAMAQRVHELLVLDGDRVVGVVCASELAGAPSLTAVMDTAPPCVAPSTTLGEVVGLLQDTDARLVLVIDGDELVGLVTQGDLERAGVPPELLWQPMGGSGPPD